MEVIHIKKKIDYDNIFINKLRVAAYIRVSTKSDIQFNSFESQINYYTSMINKNTNWTLYKIYSDFGISGTKANNRDDFINMINEALKGNIDFIITKSISRFARNTKDLLTIVRKFNERKIGIYFEEENINTLNLESEFLLSVLASVAQSESENTSSHIITSVKHMMENGKVFSIPRTYGYKSINKKLKVIKKEAEIVKKIFQLYLEDYSYKDICKYLNNHHIKTLKGYEWRVATISNLLSKSIYTGDLYQGRYKYNKINSMYLIKNNHPAIIDKDTWNKVQEKLSRNKSKAEIRNDYLKNIYCGVCNKNVYYQIKISSNKTYLKCYDKTCKLAQIKTEIFEKAFVELLLKIINMNNNINEYKAKYIKLNNLLNKYQKDKNEILEEFMSNKINNYIYNKKINLINSKLENIKLEIDKINNYISVIKRGNNIRKDIINKIIDTVDDVSKFNYELYYKIVDFALWGRIEKVRTYNNKVIRFYYNDGFDFLNIKKDDYIKYSEEFELYLSFSFKEVFKKGKGKLYSDNVKVEFYIRKD